MSIFGYIAKGFSIAKSSGSLILTVFAFSFIWTLLNLPFVSLDGTTPPNPISIVLGVLFMLASVFIQAGSIGYVEQVAKNGRAALGAFTQAGTKNYLRMFGLGIVVGLMVLILAVIAVIGFVAGGSQAQPSPVAIVLAVVMALLGLLLLIFLFFAPYAVVVDGKGIFGSLKSSISIVKKAFFKVLLVAIILVAIGFVIGFLIGLLAGVLAGVMPGKAGQAVGGLLSSAINAYLGVVTTGAFMTLYLNASGAGSQVSSSSN